MDEQATPPAGRVAQSEPATRSAAIASTVLALLALGVVLMFTRDRSHALATSALTAVAWDAAMIVVGMAKGPSPPPLAIRPAELPQTVSQFKAARQGTLFLACLFAFAVAFSFALHNYVAFGIVLGTPIMVWYSLGRTRGTERELGGTLWAPAKMAWTAKGRHWFLVTETDPADGAEPWD